MPTRIITRVGIPGHRRVKVALAAMVASSGLVLISAPVAQSAPAACSGTNAQTVATYGTNLYTSLNGNSQLARIDLANPAYPATIVAGLGSSSAEGISAKQASLGTIFDVAIDGDGDVYIVAGGTGTRIRRITSGPDGVVNGGPGEIIMTVAGNGTSGNSGDGGTATAPGTTGGRIRFARNISFGSTGNMYFAVNFDNRVRMVTTGADSDFTGAADEIISTVAGGGVGGDGAAANAASISGPVGTAVVITPGGPDQLFITEGGRLRKVTAGADNVVNGSVDDIISTFATGYSSGQGIYWDPIGSNFYVATAITGSQFIRKVTPAAVATVVAGTGIAGYSGDGGPATSAQIADPTEAVLDTSGNLIIADSGNARTRMVVPGAVTGLSGDADETISTTVGTAGTTVSTCPHLWYDYEDYDGDLAADLATFRPSENVWYLKAGSTETGTYWGATGDIPVPGEYNGDGKTDLATFRPSENVWYVKTAAGESGTYWGGTGDIPVPGDYDGDGLTDLATFRPSENVWYVKTAATEFATYWGGTGDIPVPGDYDGDGKTDLATFRPSENVWYVKTATGESATYWGGTGDIPVPGDYDGDGLTDLATFRPSENVWYVKTAATEFATYWGASGDIPVPGDYDGDGKTDLATFRPSENVWYVKTATGESATYWGASGDRPLSLPHAIRSVFFP